MPHSDSQGKDSVDLINRDSLFFHTGSATVATASIQQFVTWKVSVLTNRESLLSTSPDSNNGEDREKLCYEEIEYSEGYYSNYKDHNQV